MKGGIIPSWGRVKSLLVVERRGKKERGKGEEPDYSV